MQIWPGGTKGQISAFLGQVCIIFCLSVSRSMHTMILIYLSTYLLVVRSLKRYFKKSLPFDNQDTITQNTSQPWAVFAPGVPYLKNI